MLVWSPAISIYVRGDNTVLCLQLAHNNQQHIFLIVVIVVAVEVSVLVVVVVLLGCRSSSSGSGINSSDNISVNIWLICNIIISNTELIFDFSRIT